MNPEEDKNSLFYRVHEAIKRNGPSGSPVSFHDDENHPSQVSAPSSFDDLDYNGSSIPKQKINKIEQLASYASSTWPKDVSQEEASNYLMTKEASKEKTKKMTPQQISDADEAGARQEAEDMDYRRREGLVTPEEEKIEKEYNSLTPEEKEQYERTVEEKYTNYMKSRIKK